MSALAGCWRAHGPKTAGESCLRMLAAQAAYGPHDQASWSGAEIALGRRLFRLTPGDAFDAQPVVGAEGHLVLVADVRLDNREEVLRDLGDVRLDPQRTSDALLLMRAFERWGEGVVDRLVGDYAFAVWDARRRRLTLARDALGQCPLHYHRGAGLFAFASMPKGLHALDEIPRAPDEGAIAAFLAKAPQTGPATFFKGVDRVEPGCLVVVTPDALQVRRYWRPRRRELRLPSEQAYVEAFREQLDEATRCRLRGAGDVVGSHLSGGYDSSAVAATAARLLASTGGRLVAFTAVPRPGYEGAAPDGRFGDEGPHAAATAALHDNIEHHRIDRGVATPLDALDRNVELFERPVLNLCNNVWEGAINDAARKHGLTVLLKGDFGNETISSGGPHLVADLFGRVRWMAWRREVAALVAAGAMDWRTALQTSLRAWLPQPLVGWVNDRFGEEARRAGEESPLLPGRLRDARRRARGRLARPGGNDLAARLWAMRRTDLGVYRKGALAGWGLDLRSPTADRRLVEFCLSLPIEQMLRDGVARPLARRALADRLPSQVLNEPRRGHQGVDWHEGLTAARPQIDAELRRLEACGPAADLIDLERLRALATTFPSSGWERADVQIAYRVVLQRGLSGAHFIRSALSPASTP